MASCTENVNLLTVLHTEVGKVMSLLFVLVSGHLGSQDHSCTLTCLLSTVCSAVGDCCDYSQEHTVNQKLLASFWVGTAGSGWATLLGISG